MPSKKKQPQIPLPKSWDKYVKSGILHVFALAQYALIYSRSWAADSSNQRVRLKAERDRWEQEVALVHEAMRIKDARMAQLAPQRRPHYPATERMAILELRAARSWSYEQAAREFLLTAETISSWVGRIDEAGATALVQTPQPINKFPDCVRYAVQRLKVLCPSLGKLKIAQVLCRAGLHLGTSTVGRILTRNLLIPSRRRSKHRPKLPKNHHRPSRLPLSWLPEWSRPNERITSGMSILPWFPRRWVFGPRGYRSVCLSAGPSATGLPW